MANPIKFTELPLAGELSSSAIVAIVQEQNGEQVSLKCSVAQVAQLIADGIEFAGLTSNDKRIIGAINEIMNKVDDLELFKFPNATIIGTPTINNGQISGFSQTSYLQFPFLMDFQGRHFAINMEFTTAVDVTNQQNIFDSDFGLAFAIRSGKFVIAVSSNGTSWNIGEGVGTHTVLPNTTYRVQLAWDGTAYKLAYSVNGGESYTEDISLASTASPFPKQVFIGVGENYAAVLNFFKGIINLNYASLYVADSLVWQGMDDVGLASRLATDLSNIDAAGEQRIKEIAGGGGGASIDDSKIATDSTWSSSKINSELGTVKSDLSELSTNVESEVQARIDGDWYISKVDTNKQTVTVYDDEMSYTDWANYCLEHPKTILSYNGWYYSPFNKPSSIWFMPFFAFDTTGDSIILTYSNGTFTQQNIATANKVEGVKINGVSILDSDKVANIPIANDSRLGIVKVNTANSLYTDGYGNIKPYSLSASNYNAKIDESFISKGTLENIKSDFTKRALTDDTQPAWTEDEKKKAQITLGILSSEGVLF